MAQATIPMYPCKTTVASTPSPKPQTLPQFQFTTVKHVLYEKTPAVAVPQSRYDASEHRPLVLTSTTGSGARHAANHSRLLLLETTVIFNRLKFNGKVGSPSQDHLPCRPKPSSRFRLETGGTGSKCSTERLTKCPFRIENRRPTGLWCNGSTARSLGNLRAKRQLPSVVHPRTTFAWQVLMSPVLTVSFFTPMDNGNAAVSARAAYSSKGYDTSMRLSRTGWSFNWGVRDQNFACVFLRHLQTMCRRAMMIRRRMMSQ